MLIGELLVRRSLEHEALKSLGRHADLVLARESSLPGSARSSTLGLFFGAQQERAAVLSTPRAELLLPSAGAAALRAGRPARGSLYLHSTRFLYAARASGPAAVVLLREARSVSGDRTPFELALLLAGLVGGALAGLAAFVLARAIARPIGRVAEASLSLAAGRRPGPLPIEGSSEVASLARAFNSMAEELARAQEAEQTFLLSVSHELKTPLTAIRGHAEALTEGVMTAPDVGPVVVREAMRLERLVQDLLDLARLRRRSFGIKREPVDLAEVVEETALRYEGQAQAFGLSLATVVSRPTAAFGDDDRLLQVVSNLVENALRCTPSGGTVTLTAGRGSLSVADTGPGLAPDDLPRAFERFFLHRLYGSSRPVGTGFGLAIVRELVEAMEGQITVESTLGRGTTFTIDLPEASGREVTEPLTRVGRELAGEARLRADEEPG